jgi:hypothetical protein
MKKCTKCGEEKELEDFYYNKQRNYYKNPCKKCFIKLQKISNSKKINNKSPKISLKYIKKKELNKFIFDIKSKNRIDLMDITNIISFWEFFIKSNNEQLDIKEMWNDLVKYIS